MLFEELDLVIQISGRMKPNLSKHDFVFGASKLSIDMVFSSFIMFLIIICIIWCIASAGEGDADPGGCDCAGCNPHTLDSLHCNGHYDCDCCFGTNERKKYTDYQNYQL